MIVLIGKGWARCCAGERRERVCVHRRGWSEAAYLKCVSSPSSSAIHVLVRSPMTMAFLACTCSCIVSFCCVDHTGPPSTDPHLTKQIVAPYMTPDCRCTWHFVANRRRYLFDLCQQSNFSAEHISSSHVCISFSPVTPLFSRFTLRCIPARGSTFSAGC